ncbi:MAG TPA: hypothetical protein PK657_01425 [Legionella sp.]|nr:hypothetical protein [Legionella sp.]
MLNLELLATREIGACGMSVCLKPRIPVVITPGLVREMRQLQNSLAEKFLSNSIDGCFYVVWFLEDRRGLGCHGLDFTYILNCIKAHKDYELERYIHSVFDLMFLNYIGLGFPVINCSIVSRTLSGLSKEFFFLNKICFLHNPKVQDIEDFSILHAYDNLIFHSDIYEKNHYFYFQSLKLEKMRSKIEEVNYEIPSQEDINRTKDKFETIKEETLKGLFELASKDLKILERMARFDLKKCA